MWFACGQASGWWAVFTLDQVAENFSSLLLVPQVSSHCVFNLIFLHTAYAKKFCYSSEITYSYK